MYFDELIGADTVNTLEKVTIAACADGYEIDSRVATDTEQIYQPFQSLKYTEINIDLDAVMDELLIEGIDKFIKPFQSLISSLEDKVKRLSPV